MKNTVKTPSPTALRRIALKHQGLLGRRRIGTGLPGVLKALERLAYVQIDTISVVERAHNHTMWTRASGFQERHFNRLIERGQAFEYWFHAASFLPMTDFRFSLPMKSAMRARHGADAKLTQHILERIRAEGPLFSRDFETPPRASRGWWDWKPAKRALETLYMRGDLMVAARHGFAKQYDLTENLLPRGVSTTEPEMDEFAEHLIDRNLTAHGFAEPPTMMHLRRGTELRRAVADALEQRLADGTLVRFPLGSRTFYAPPQTLETPPKPPAVARVLSPFDNSVIHRTRSQAVFDFDFVLECYVPEPKRRWGYFCLPILYRDRFVGRMDCKAHRAEGRFEIKTLFVEADVDDAFPSAFDATVRDYAAFTGCTEVTLTTARPSRFESMFA